MGNKNQSGYRSISDMEQVFQRKVKNCFNSLLPSEVKGPILLRRLPIKSLTPRATNYTSIIKKMQDLFDVKVYRNENNIEEGLYVVGKQYLVDTYISVLSSIIKVIETNNEIYQTARYIQHITLNYTYLVFDLVDYKNTIISDEVRDDCLRDEILTETFIKETSFLKAKKRYYEKLNHIPK